MRSDSLVRMGGASTWGTAAIAGSAVVLGALETRRRTQDDRRLVGPFDVEVEWAYADGADKLGHIVSTGIQAEAYAAAYQLAGHSREDAALWGAATSFAWMLHYEVLDGFGRREVFDPSDLAANAVGAGLVAARVRIPELEAVRMKISYWPSGDTCDATCDYAGQTAWLTVAPRLLAPEADWLPPWLGVAVGYGVREGSVGRGGFEENHVTLALDLEPGGLGLSGPVWGTVLPFLRRVHFPSPGVRLTPRPRLVLAY
ncbi:MAG: DUF2279 domain-containing protein [Bacteroidota bacterium]